MNRSSNGRTRLVYLSLLKKGSGQHGLCRDLFIGVSGGAKCLDRLTAELFCLRSLAGIAIQLRQRQASFGGITFIAELLFQGEGLTVSLLCLIWLRLEPEYSAHLS